jgi:hypothetical protein
MRRRRQNISLKLLGSVSYDVEDAAPGVAIDENVKQRKGAITLRSPASSSRWAPARWCAPARAQRYRHAWRVNCVRR